MAQKINPISIRLNLNRSSDSSWFSDYYYEKLLYQDVNFRDYFDLIRPPTGKTFGFGFVLVSLLFIIFLKGHSSTYFFWIDLADQDTQALGQYNWSS